MSACDDFTRKVFRQAIRHYRFVTGTKEMGNTLVFTLENYAEELTITKGADDYLFIYTSPTGDRAKTQKCKQSELTISKLQSILGLLIYV